MYEWEGNDGAGKEQCRRVTAHQLWVVGILTTVAWILQQVLETEAPSDDQSQTNVEMAIERSVDPGKLHNAIETFAMYCA